MEREGTPVLLTMTGSARNERGEAEEPVKLMTTGVLKPSASGYMLRYQESQTDEGDGSVMTQDIILLMQPGRVTMTRLGDFGTSMVFVKDRRFEGVYHTPYGDLDMALFATQVSVSLAPDHGSVSLEYQLDLQGNYVSMHTLRLEYVAGEDAQPC